MSTSTKSKPAKTPPRERVRITLDLSPAGHERLQKLAQSAGSSAAVLRNALQLYEFVVEQTGAGCRFTRIDKDGKETELRFLGYTD